MSRPTPVVSICHYVPWRVRRTAASSLEAIMAFTLLSSVLAFSTPLIVRHQRLVASQRDYRLALDEATNQLERLSTLSSNVLPAAVEKLKPSDFVAARLPGAKLHGQIAAADIGQHVTISISWGDGERSPAPIVLTAWFLPVSADSGRAAERRNSP